MISDEGDASVLGVSSENYPTLILTWFKRLREIILILVVYKVGSVGYDFDMILIKN